MGYPISLARGAYWIGICYEKMEKNKLSQDYFAEGSKYLTTFMVNYLLKKLIQPDNLS